MKNIEKYKNEIMNASHKNLTCCVNADILNLPCSSRCKECKKSVVKWLLEEYKEPILDDVEKAYLNSVIKPFRKKVNSITKILVCDSKKCFIRIRVNNTEHVNLPNFNIASGMYAGMRSFRAYTLEELGL